MSQEPLWTPDPRRVEASGMEAFRHRIQDCHGAALPDSRALHRWSLAHPGAFWREVWDFCRVIGDPGEVDFDPGPEGLEGARFLPDARLNFAENLLAGPADRDRPALVFEGEDGQRRVMSWTELRRGVAGTARALQNSGVSTGDRVAAWMPNLPETVILMLAAASIGAIFSSTSSDFGASGVVDRFGQIEPAVLVAADGYRYSGREHGCLDRLIEIRAALPSLKETIVVGHLSSDPDLGRLPGAKLFSAWAAPGDEEPAFVRLPFDHPLAILYSSGTTGAPKCIVHRAGGLLLKHLCEHRLHCDLREGDTAFYFTTCGWMMWNWLVSALATKATVALYDGNPLFPGPESLFDLARRNRVQLLGVSAKYIDAVRKSEFHPRDGGDFPSLRTLCSTGSPLSPEGFRFVHESVKKDLHLASISGGTDLCGCFVLGDPTRPVHVGQIQGPALGLAVDVFDEHGRPCAAGSTGELVCTNAFPSMPLGFWGDLEGSRYHQAYFARFPGTWAHGDFAGWTEEGGMVIHGRSDATLNAGGVRIGTAEIYRQVELLPEVGECIAVAQAWQDDTRIVLFVRPAPGHRLDDPLRERIRLRLRQNCSPRHVPARILEVPEIPRTRSGKIVELAVADVVNGRPVRNTEALANPAALEAFRNRAELAD